MKSHPLNPVHPVKTPWPKVRLGDLCQLAAGILQKEQRIAEIMGNISKLQAKA